MNDFIRLLEVFGPWVAFLTYMMFGAWKERKALTGFVQGRINRADKPQDAAWNRLIANGQKVTEYIDFLKLEAERERAERVSKSQIILEQVKSGAEVTTRAAEAIEESTKILQEMTTCLSRIEHRLEGLEGKQS